MTNKEIAKAFQRLAQIMELHEENPFKIRSYENAYLTLRKLPSPLGEMTDEEISSLKGIGKAIGGKIRELLDTGQLTALRKYEEITPSGVCEMLDIPGFGPKKIRVIWKELGVENPGELLYACNENRLVELKGFGEKTQEDLRQKLEYFQKSLGKFLFADLEKEAELLLVKLQAVFTNAKISLTGEIRRCCNVVDRIEILIDSEDTVPLSSFEGLIIEAIEDGEKIIGRTIGEIPVAIYRCQKSDFGSKLFRYTGGKEFLESFLALAVGKEFKGIANEKEVFEKAGLPFIEPELRDQPEAVRLAKSGNLPDLIAEKDIRGVVHAHTTYSDGLHSIREMAGHAKALGFEYFGVTDHSKAAFYANGLKEDRLLVQWEEIDILNRQMAPFKIFKGIESDILTDGSLDYPEEILNQFDFVIASVHTNLKMDEEKATVRILRAVENPHTTILGHLTGRLLLSRKGYPLNHSKIIDACAANHVAIELNANPYRLDLDWSWIPKALEKGVLISINPDAHSTGGIKDIHFGVLSARKGGLTAKACLTCKSAVEFKDFITARKPR